MGRSRSRERPAANADSPDSASDSGSNVCPTSQLQPSSLISVHEAEDEAAVIVAENDVSEVAPTIPPDSDVFSAIDTELIDDDSSSDLMTFSDDDDCSSDTVESYHTADTAKSIDHTIDSVSSRTATSEPEQIDSSQAWKAGGRQPCELCKDVGLGGMHPPPCDDARRLQGLENKRRQKPIKKAKQGATTKTKRRKGYKSQRSDATNASSHGESHQTDPLQKCKQTFRERCSSCNKWHAGKCYAHQEPIPLLSTAQGQCVDVPSPLLRKLAILTSELRALTASEDANHLRRSRSRAGSPMSEKGSNTASEAQRRRDDA